MQAGPTSAGPSEASGLHAGPWLKVLFNKDFLSAYHLVGPLPPAPCHLLAIDFLSGACSPAPSWGLLGHTPWLS